MTPRLAVRLAADGTGYTDIDAAQVEQLNVLQLANAYRYLYAAPSAPMDAFVDANRATWRHPLQIDVARTRVRQMLRTLPRPAEPDRRLPSRRRERRTMTRHDRFGDGRSTFCP